MSADFVRSIFHPFTSTSTAKGRGFLFAEAPGGSLSFFSSSVLSNTLAPAIISAYFLLFL